MCIGGSPKPYRDGQIIGPGFHTGFFERGGGGGGGGEPFDVKETVPI